MITPQLEKMLITGKAKFKTFFSHLTAVSLLPVPAGQFIIITDVTINPFTDRDIAEAFNDIQTDQRSTHGIDFFSGNDRNGFLFRNNYSINLFPGGIAPADLYLVNSEPVHFNTFFVHTEDVYISLWTKMVFGGLTSGNFKPLTKTNLPRPPVSYGDSENVLTDNTDFTAFKYIPTSASEAAVALAAGAPSSNQPNTIVNAASGIQNPYANLRNYFSPLYNIGYVTINETNRQNLVG